MNKSLKIFIATSISLGGLFGTINFNHSDTGIVHAETTPYYKYKGNTGHDGRFVLDSTFINAIKYKGVEMNGYKIVQPQSDDGNNYNHKKAYDQHFYLSKSSQLNYAASVKFPVKRHHISKSQLLKAYGNNYTIEESGNKTNYKFLVGSNIIIFTIEDNYVTTVNIGEDIGSRM